MRALLVILPLSLLATAVQAADFGYDVVPLRGTYDTMSGRVNPPLKNPLKENLSGTDFYPDTYSYVPSDYGMQQCQHKALGRDFTFTFEGHASGFSAKCEYKPLPTAPSAGDAFK